MSVADMVLDIARVIAFVGVVVSLAFFAADWMRREYTDSAMRAFDRTAHDLYRWQDTDDEPIPYMLDWCWREKWVEQEGHVR